MVGTSIIILTVSFVAGHEPLDIVHTRIFVPVVKPVTAELFTLGDVTEAPPETTDHVPVPAAGIFPFNVAVVFPQNI